MTGLAILTASEIRRAEEAAISLGTDASTLMDRAGRGAAEAIRLFAGPVPALVLCGPGNNGGDGYVIARALREAGVAARVAALGEPKTQAALAARQTWDSPIEDFKDAEPAHLIVDALFGTGLTRSFDEAVARKLGELAAAARVTVAVDVPSGVSTDDGALLSPVPRFDLTVTFAAMKPCHLLQPAASVMGRIVVADIGVAAEGLLTQVARPRLRTPGPADHKYSRGYVAVLAGEMPGAAALTAGAALRSGAGYVRLVGKGSFSNLPSAVVVDAAEPTAVLADTRIGAAAVGPGLGRGAAARTLLEIALVSDTPLILDADALTLAAEEGPALFLRARHCPVLTPHAGEFSRLFGSLSGSKVEQARQAAEASGSVVVYKGADTVIAAPDGRAAVAASTGHWLAPRARATCSPA
ncbi:MAG TPA: NAD(P)H-hydrate epimerase [Allosphingosinicella sp.]